MEELSQGLGFEVLNIPFRAPRISFILLLADWMETELSAISPAPRLPAAAMTVTD